MWAPLVVGPLTTGELLRVAVDRNQPRQAHDVTRRYVIRERAPQVSTVTKLRKSSAS